MRDWSDEKETSNLLKDAQLMITQSRQLIKQMSASLDQLKNQIEAGERIARDHHLPKSSEMDNLSDPPLLDKPTINS